MAWSMVWYWTVQYSYCHTVVTCFRMYEVCVLCVCFVCVFCVCVLCVLLFVVCVCLCECVCVVVG